MEGLLLTGPTPSSLMVFNNRVARTMALIRRPKTPLESVTRKGSQGKFVEIATRTGTYHKSALPYLTRLLNQD